VIERLGEDTVVMAHRARGVTQNGTKAVILFDYNPDGCPAAPVEASIVVACDGFHSAIRHQFYPHEDAPHFGGINMWRGITRRKPFLSGASVARVGSIETSKLVVYAIRKFRDGTQFINWNTEQPRDDHKPNDWATPGRLEDFIEPFADWHFDWLDVPALFADAEFILEYPMVDRDPVGRWVFDRVALMGDAAHPMYPRGGNGGAQAILDAECLAGLLGRDKDRVRALKAFETERLKPVSDIVLMNRAQPPDFIIETVERLTRGKLFDRIEDVISPAELAAISDRYKEVAGYDVNSTNQ